MIAGLFGAVIGSAHPIAAALVSALAGALLAGVSMVVCIATMPDHVFGVSKAFSNLCAILFRSIYN